MKQLITLIIITLSFCTSWAQPSSHISLKSYEKAAMDAEQNNNFSEAYRLYAEAYEKFNRPELLQKMAMMQGQLRDYTQAESLFKKLAALEDNQMDASTIIYYVRMLKSLGRYDDALAQFSHLDDMDLDPIEVEYWNREKEGILFAKRSSAPRHIAIKNMGESINGATSEYSPYLTEDGDLYFSALNNRDIVDALNQGDYRAKIYRSSAGKSNFKSPKKLDKVINHPDFHQSSFCFSEDGKTLFFTRQTVENGNKITSSQLLKSNLVKNKWSEPKSVFNAEDVLYKSPSIGKYNGKRVLFFISDMEGGQGGYDIYYAALDKKNQLGTPTNIGGRINTMYNEESPFYYDGNLYFSSKGHIGLGGYDVFKVSLSDGDSKVMNLGLPYNSSADDLYFKMGDAYHSVLASNRVFDGSKSLQGLTCCNDLYSIEVANIMLDVKVQDQKSKETLADAKVVLENAKGNIIPIEAANKDVLLYKLNPDETYTLMISADGYEEKNITVSTKNQWTTIRLSELVYLEPIVVVKKEEPEVITYTEPIVLDEILFDYDDDKILPTALGDMNYLLKLLNQFPDMKIRVTSHTDTRGSKSYNQKLSQRRSESVRNWLISRGISAERISALGMSSEVPVKVYEKAANANSFLRAGDVLDENYISSLKTKAQREIAHQLNRRSEFEIVEGPKVIIKKK